MKARMIILAAVAIALGVVAYLTLREPTQEKAERLHREMTVACFRVEYGAATSEQRAECDVARREYNKFIN